jgi:hypothetical protein
MQRLCGWPPSGGHLSEIRAEPRADAMPARAFERSQSRRAA